uniref:perilipin-2-like n=1 Tax=Myxine glutinosa TaxID=7769 RepID=UPI00358F18A7
MKSQIGVGVKRSKQVVLGAMEALLNSRVGRTVLSSAHSMLSQAEQYLDLSLPHDKPEGEGHDEKVAVPSSSSIAFYPRLVAVSSKASWEIYKKSAAGIEHLAVSGRAHLTSARKALNTAFDFVVQKTSNRVVDVTHQDGLDPGHSSDQKVDATANELKAK